MKKVILLIILYVCFITTPVVASSPDWHTMDNGTQVYGVRHDTANTWLVIAYDPDTGQQLDYAYYNTGYYEESEVEVIQGYEYKKVESLDRVKEVKPVTVEKVFAPNISSSYINSWQEDGTTVKLNQLETVWPGGGHMLVPGSDSNYWLIVASVNNPNDFPVKADVTIDYYNLMNSQYQKIGRASCRERV